MLRLQLTEATAGDVFQRADKAGQPITMEMVRQRLAELSRHPADCHCGCAVARVVKAADVYRIAATWQRQCDATRARSRR